MRSTVLLWLFLSMTCLAACASNTESEEALDGIDDSFTTGGAADSFGIDEDSNEACSVLEFVNRAWEGEVTQTVGATVSQRIFSVRFGPDNRPETSDDNPIESLAELDAIPYVGARAFAKMVAHVRGSGWEALCNGGTFEPGGLIIDRWSACATLRLVNEATRNHLHYDVDIYWRTIDGLIAARPMETMEELDAVPYVASSFMTNVHNYFHSHYTDWACDGDPKGTFRSCTILGTADNATEEELVERAGISVRAARSIVDHRPYRSMEELDAAPYVTESVIERVYAFARAWYPCGEDPGDD